MLALILRSHMASVEFDLLYRTLPTVIPLSDFGRE